MPLSPAPRFLSLQAPHAAACLEESLLFLRQAWSGEWPGLPAVFQACCDFLQLTPAQLSVQAQRMLAAGVAVATASEAHWQAQQAQEPHYHNRLHTADVLTAMALQLGIEARLTGWHDSDWLTAGLLCAVGHDFMHAGGVNTVPCEIERRSCEQMRPLLLQHAVDAVWQARVEAAILCSDFSLAKHNHLQVQGRSFAWNQAWLNVLLNEADVLASSLSSHGPLLSQALAQEWALIGYAPHATVATLAGRQAFLRSVQFSSASSKALGVRPQLQAQLSD